MPRATVAGKGHFPIHNKTQNRTQSGNADTVFSNEVNFDWFKLVPKFPVTMPDSFIHGFFKSFMTELSLSRITENETSKRCYNKNIITKPLVKLI